MWVLDDGTKTTFIVADARIEQCGTITTVNSANDFMLRFWKNDVIRSKIQLKNYVFDLKIFDNSLAFWSDKSITIAYAYADCSVVLCQLSHDDCFNELFKFTGHSDWIRSIGYKFSEDDTLFIASAAQDNFIRLWKVTKSVKNQDDSMIEQTFTDPNKQQFVVSLETVLAGHEAAVYSVKFIRTNSSKLSLLSSSLDKSVVLWEEPENGSGDGDVWNEKLRVGEIGGNNMGFLGVSFPSTMDSFSNFCAYSYNGSVHIWKFNNETNSWETDIGYSGHYDVVTDIAWSPSGNYMLSTSNDETTRLHCAWRNEGKVSWHEIARPQIHGYLINCIAVLNELTYISGADEKVLRVFRATKNFVNSLKNISGYEVESSKIQLPETATTPALGLSNRAVYSEKRNSEDGDTNAEFDKDDMVKSLGHPPPEELLMESTLWPELHKLYGHGYEVFAVAASHDGKLVASSCKATKPDQAGIILWDATQTFKQCQALCGHTLTVTSIKFSPDDQMIVSVSRDRAWFLYRRDSSDQFVKVANSDKKSGIHTRIIWDVSWTPDSNFFVTASRDKKIILWSVTTDPDVIVKPIRESILTLHEAIMTVDVYGECLDSKYLIALGMENGDVRLYSWVKNVWSCINSPNESLLKHSLCVRKVRFAPPSEKEVPQKILMATCGDDYKVQIFTIES